MDKPNPDPTASQLLLRGLDASRPDQSDWEPIEAEDLDAIFDERYTILSMLGRGGMGAVYRARDTRLDRDVAIKLLPAKLGDDPEMKSRFEREAKALAALDHPHIVHIYDYGSTEDEHLYIVMEYIAGMDLVALRKSTALNLSHALKIVSQVCSALQYAHDEGIIHRDIKPANILVTTSGKVKVADFGLSRALDTDLKDFTLTVTGAVMGTPDYMAPEQRKSETVDHRADIYAVGIMLYELLTGSPPQGAWKPPSEKEALDVRLDRVVTRALQEDKTARYQQASEIKTDLDSIHSSSRGAVLPKKSKYTLLPSEIKNGAPPSGSNNFLSNYYRLIASFLVCCLLGYLFWKNFTRDNHNNTSISEQTTKKKIEISESNQKPKDRSHLNGLILSASLPPADEYGSYSLFDGKTLYGIDPNAPIFNDPDLLRCKDGVLELRFSSLKFNHTWDTNSFFFSVVLKKVHGQSLKVAFTNNKGHTNKIWFNGRDMNDTVGIGQKINDGWKDLKLFRCSDTFYKTHRLDSFFTLEYWVKNHTHNVVINNKALVRVHNSNITGELQPSLEAERSTVKIKEIRIKPFHKNQLPKTPSYDLKDLEIEYDEATLKKLNTFVSLAQLYPDSPMLQFNAGKFYVQTDQLDKAIAAFEKVIELDKTNAYAYCKLGEIYQYQKKQPRKALRYFEKGHQIGSGQSNWHQPSDQWIYKCKRAIAELEKNPKEKEQTE